MKRNWKQILYENQDKTISEVAELTGVVYRVVQHHVKKHGISLKDGRSKNKPSFNEHFFSCIDTQEKAYWLGFLMADGYNNVNRGYIELTLKESDIEVLEKFAISLGLKNPNITHPKLGIVRLVLHSRFMSEDLTRLGCGKAKTYTLEYPNICKELERHFIRGYFDGDGSYVLNSRTFDLTGRKNFLMRVIDVFESLGLNRLKIYQRYPDRENDISYIRYGGRNVSNTLYHYLYDEATVYLTRKHDKFRKGVYE